MRVFQKELSFKTKGLYGSLKVTAELQEVLSESKIGTGLLFANAVHNTAALILQEADGTIFQDMKAYLENILPLKAKYAHDYESNENATAHQKSNLLGTTVSVPVNGGQLILGTWQDVFLVELFESRERKIIVTVIGE